MREVAILSFAQTPPVRREARRNETEMLLGTVAEAFDRAGLDERRADFTCSGSSDYLSGLPFSFVFSLDALGAWPPIAESHLEMDGAFALYEAWVRLQCGDVDTALVYAFGKSRTGNLDETLALQLDPYCVAPLWPDPTALAALQARALLDEGVATERDLALVAARSRGDARRSGRPLADEPAAVEALLGAPMVASPLRAHDCSIATDGAAAVVLAAGDRARTLASTRGTEPVWIRGIDHRIDVASLGARDLARSPSTRAAAEHAARAAGFAPADCDLAELHARFTSEELILRRELGLGSRTIVNPSGGALAANPTMVAGLVRLGEAAERLRSGAGRRALAHATSGPCLQQNLVALLEVGE
jgi:acetyl-CoA acetyltransferase